MNGISRRVVKRGLVTGSLLGIAALAIVVVVVVVPHGYADAAYAKHDAVVDDLRAIGRVTTYERQGTKCNRWRTSLGANCSLPTIRITMETLHPYGGGTTECDIFGQELIALQFQKIETMPAARRGDSCTISVSAHDITSWFFLPADSADRTIAVQVGLIVDGRSPPR